MTTNYIKYKDTIRQSQKKYYDKNKEKLCKKQREKYEIKNKEYKKKYYQKKKLEKEYNINKYDDYSFINSDNETDEYIINKKICDNIDKGISKDPKLEKIKNEKINKAHNVSFSYGKYKNMSLFDIYKKDKMKGLRYIKWMRDNYINQYNNIDVMNIFLDKYYFKL
jgi:hypothetical protein